MLMTRLHSTRDYAPWLQRDLPTRLPNTVGGYLWRYISLQKPVFFFVTINNMIDGVLTLTVAYAVKRIIDAVGVTGVVTDPAAALAVAHGPFLLFLACIIGRFCMSLSLWACIYLSRGRMTARGRMEAFSYVAGHEPAFFEDELSGRIIQKTNDMATMTDATMGYLRTNLIPAATQFIASLVFLATANWILAAFMSVWLVIYYLISVATARGVPAYAAAAAEGRAKATGAYADVIGNARVMFTFGRQQAERDNLAAALSAQINGAQESYLAMLNVRIANKIMYTAGYIALIGGGMWLWAHGGITVGDFVMISTIAVVVLQRAAEISYDIPDQIDNLATLDNAIKTLVRPSAVQDAPGAPALQVSQGRIVFNQVDFTYPKASRPVFSTFALDIAPGERIGLVGASGAGKSTLVALLLRIYDVTGGAITIDGQNVRAVTQDSLRAAIGYIPQDTALFHRSLAANIGYGRPDATREEIEDVSRAAAAHDFIAELGSGYETMVGEREVKLSGGQRQRVAIARALLKNAPILLLDEATSALDSESEAVIQAAIESAMVGKTVIAIAHRLSTIAKLDRLIVLDQGRIVESGSHAELLAQNGRYARLWQRQSGGFIGNDG